MGSIDYEELYRLQDSVLDGVFETEELFYLTGGTALSRFYHPKRYSDDLDFFTNDSSRFSYAVKNIVARLQQTHEVAYELEVRDFVRLRIDGVLQVDFVNDRVPRYGEPNVLQNGYRIDTIENILTNKLTAVLGRDNPKDIFDIYLIDQFHAVDWKKMVDAAHEKMVFSEDDLTVRLRSFPHRLLDQIRLIDEEFLADFSDRYANMVATIETALTGE
jgi:predicted nucleotidyltransferase component of viral defense system